MGEFNQYRKLGTLLYAFGFISYFQLEFASTQSLLLAAITGTWYRIYGQLHS